MTTSAELAWIASWAVDRMGTPPNWGTAKSRAGWRSTTNTCFQPEVFSKAQP